MGSIPLIFIILLFHLHKSKSQTIQSAHLLDLMIRDYTIRNFNIHFKTGTIQKIHLPSNFSSIDIDTAKFRCGSLRRHGARIGEFHFGPGLTVEPCVERVILVRQNLGFIWSSSMYSTGYNHKLVSPVLGLLAYNSNPDGVSPNPYEVNVMGTEQNPILIDFLSSKASGNPRSKNSSLLCACFTSNGNITFREQVSAFVCLGTTQGHYALVIRAHGGDGSGGGVVTPPSSPINDGGNGRLSRWKVAVGSVIGSVIGALLLGLLVVAMLVKGKKKAMREEMERRAYEEEAFQVSMVGHVRANPNASRTRTVPRFDNNRYSNKQ